MSDNKQKFIDLSKKLIDQAKIFNSQIINNNTGS